MSRSEVPSETHEETRGRRLTTEEMVRIQLERANQIRSDVTNPDRITIWSECLEALYDLLLPWWNDDEEWQEEWENRPLAVVESPNGGRVPAPTGTDCRAAHLLLMKLLHKNKMLVRTRTSSGPAPRKFDPPASDAPKNHVVTEREIEVSE